jgi:trk system potassium uptake protein TrkH
MRLNVEIVSALLLGLAALEVLAIPVAWAYGEPMAPFVWSALPGAVLGAVLLLLTRGADRHMRPRDGLFVVCTAWVLVSLFGALPYITGHHLGIVDAIFESTSGFTTTGSTVVVDVQTLPRSILLWRSMTQWIGGMGIIVLTVAILPYLGIGGMQLFKNEVPGPVKGKLSPRIADTARRLYFIYIGLTIAAFLCLWVAGLDVFEAGCHALTTLSTGGFSTRNQSIGSFDSVAVEWIIIVFMFLAGINFMLHYWTLCGRARDVAKDEELRAYVVICGVMILIVAWSLRDPGITADGFRAAVFQVVSLLTTTGFATTDYELWPQLGIFLLLILLVIGGMAGSTAGGIKTIRIIIGWRAVKRSVAVAPHRNAIRKVHFSGEPVREATVSGVLVFFVMYFGLALLSAALLAGAGYDLATSISAALTTIGNVGPGLGQVGPTDHFAHLPDGIKLSLSACMIAGRLEIISLLALFHPLFWRR